MDTSVTVQDGFQVLARYLSISIILLFPAFILCSLELTSVRTGRCAGIPGLKEAGAISEIRVELFSVLCSSAVGTYGFGFI